ncbi:MAG: endonuclease/exonuclease/phosphatase family protein [Actinomycetota bacterium]|nr:endonuclease/exonuclease/phosphatase family protein [Actinomycetota bacterium]
MRLATWNLLHGISLSDGQVQPSRLLEGARALDADVLGLQEVDRGQPRSAGRDQTAEVGRATGAADWRFVPALVGERGGRWRAADDSDADDASGLHYGVGLVTRFPVQAWHVVRLPAAGRRAPLLLPGSGRLVWLEDEPRVALAAVVDTPVGTMTVATTHLSFLPGWNGAQLRRVTAALARLPSPRVLLADLNMPPPFPRLLTGWRVLARAATYPSPRPRVQLDHVLASGSLPDVRAVHTPALPVSDHRALLVELV